MLKRIITWFFRPRMNSKGQSFTLAGLGPLAVSLVVAILLAKTLADKVVKGFNNLQNSCQ